MEHDIYQKLDDGNYIKIDADDSGNLLKYMILKTRESKQFAGYALMKKDINLVLEALQQLNEIKESSIIKQSLSFFSIITYAKCFVTNNGRGVKLQGKDVFKKASQKLIGEHERIMRLRMEHVAHAGSDYEKCSVVSSLYIINSDFVGGFNLNANLGFVSSIQPYTEVFIELCDYLNIYLDRKIEYLKSEIFEYLGNLGSENLIENSISPDVNNLYSLVISKNSVDGKIKTIELTSPLNLKNKENMGL